MAVSFPGQDYNSDIEHEDSVIPVPTDGVLDEDSLNSDDHLHENPDVTEVMPNLFVINGRPMTFYVTPCPSRHQINSLILAGGGIATKTYVPEAITLVEPKTNISSKIASDCYSISYIADAVIEDKLPDLNQYLMKSKRKKTTRRDSIHSPRRRHKFTEEDDAKLSAFVMQHNDLGMTPSSSRLWRMAEDEKLTQGRHTWQSMRSRYLKVIHPSLERLTEEDSLLSKSKPGYHSDYYSEVFEELSQPSKKPKLESMDGLYLHPRPVMIDEAFQTIHKKETVNAVIDYLKSLTQQPVSVIVHALIVNNGVVRDALEYIQDPAEFCSTRNKVNQIWVHSEDKILLEKDDHHGLEQLERERGKDAVSKRLDFLES